MPILTIGIMNSFYSGSSLSTRHIKQKEGTSAMKGLFNTNINERKNTQ